MAGDNPLPQLRRVRDQIRQIEPLTSERDGLIRRAAELGLPQREIAKAAGVSQSRVNQIVNSR